MGLFKLQYTAAQVAEAIDRALNVLTDGATYVNRGAWTSGGSYSNTSETIDVVIYNGTSYFCLVTHSGQSTAPSADTTRWALLHAYETFIKNAVSGELADADTVPFTDVSDSSKTKKTTWESIKTALSSLFTTDKLKLAGYNKAAEKTAVAVTDTINQAIGKLEAGIDANASTLSDHADMLEEHGEAIEAQSTQINNLDAEMKLEITKVDRELNDLQRTLSQVNVNQEAKQTATGYGIVNLPKNAANGMASAGLKGVSAEVEGGTKHTARAGRLRSVGKNLFDKYTFGAYIDSVNGKTIVSSNAAYSLEYMRVKPNTQYVFNANDLVSRYVYFYDGNYNYISFVYGNASTKSTVFSTPSNCSFVRLTVAGITGKEDIVKFSQLEEGSTTTPYEPYTESSLYYKASSDLRSNTTDADIIRRSSDGKYELVQNVSKVDGSTLTSPVVTPIETSGTLLSNPSGTVYQENAVADAGIYTDKMTILNADLPIASIEKISKIDFATGIETEINVASAVIAGDQKSFTHPALASGDIVFFTYLFEGSTTGGTEITYYDSRHVLKDRVTGKFYKQILVLDNLVPSFEFEEV